MVIKHGQTEKLLRLQRDLGIALSATSDQKEALQLILDATCRIEGIDCGGIYLFDKTTGSLELIVHRGLPAGFVEEAAHYPPNAPQVKLLMSAIPIYGLFPEISCHRESECTDEGLKALAVIPVMDKQKVIGALNLASHSHDHIPNQARHALESIATQIGGVFGRLAAESLLRESQQDLQALFDSIEDFVFILDSGGNILSVNPTVENRLGYTADALSSMHALELHPQEQREEAAAIIKEMIDGKLTECPVPLLAKGGAIIPVETKVTKGRWRGRDVLIGISRDITRRKKVEDQLQRAHDGLERRVALRTAELAEVNEDLKKEIAEHKKTEAKLRESEANYRDLFNVEPDAIIITEVENKKIIDANPAALHLYGYRYEEMCGLSALSLSAEPNKSERHINTVAKDLVGGHNSSLAYRLHKRADGTVFPVEIATGLYSHKGRKLVCAMIRDITAREKAEESLKNAYRIIERSYAVAFLWQNRLGWPVQFVTENVAAVFGYSAADFMSGKISYRAVVHPDDLDRVEREVKGYSSEKDREEFTHKPYRVIKKDGGVIWVEDKTFLRRDKNGTITHYQGIVSDITEKHAAEELIKESEARYRSFVQNFHGIVFRGHLDFTPIFMHGAIEEITGYSEDELVNGSIRWDQLIHPDDLAAKIERTTKINTVPAYRCETEYRILRKDGTVRWVHEYIQNVCDASGNPSYVQGALYDVTEKRQLQQERLKIQKLESLGVLAGGIAHDFNNFLTGIIGNLSLVKLDIGPTSTVCDSIKRMESAALRAKDLTQQLLTFSKGGEPVKSSLHLPDLLDEAVGFSLRGANLKCSYIYEPDLKPVEADAGQISQVVNNLVINAVQATPQGGLLKINAENVVLDIDNAENLTPGAYVKIAITDQGVGIPTAHFARIFDPYFTTKQKGSGLGLTVAFSIIDKHDGRITVESELGVGTTFQILLPASAKTVPKAVKSENKIFKGKGRVLVMDDEVLIRDVAARFLKVMGFEAALAEDGSAALDMYRQAKESGQPFDIVIMDLTIPGGMGGKECVQNLLAYDSEAVAIVSSGYSNDPIMSNCEAHGFKGVVKKPFRIEELSDVLRVLFGEKARRC